VSAEEVYAEATRVMKNVCKNGFLKCFQKFYELWRNHVTAKENYFGVNVMYKDISIKKMFLGSKVRPVRGADKLTAIYESIVYTMWDH
jgi:hypothetical protein